MTLVVLRYLIPILVVGVLMGDCAVSLFNEYRHRCCVGKISKFCVFQLAITVTVTNGNH